MKFTIFFPFIMSIFQIGAIVFSVTVGLHLMSLNEPPSVLTNFNATDCKCEGPAAGFVNGGECDREVFKKNCFSASNEMCLGATCGNSGVQWFPGVMTFFHVSNY